MALPGRERGSQRDESRLVGDARGTQNKSDIPDRGGLTKPHDKMKMDRNRDSRNSHLLQDTDA